MNDTDQPDVRQALHSLVADEPAMALRLDRVVHDGRALRLRRRSLRVGAPLALLAMVGAGITWGLANPAAAPAAGARSSSGPTRSALPTTELPTTELPALTIAAQNAPLTYAGRSTLRKKPSGAGVGPVLAQVVRAQTPAGWTLDFAMEDWGDLNAADAQVTPADGSAPGHLSISATLQAGMLTVHPCRDSEFRNGATCTETTRSDGSFLTIRGLTSGEPWRTILVSITRRNGTGTFAEAGNFILPPQPASGTLVTPEEKAALAAQVTRDAPPYTVDQLLAMVEAADAAVR